jgi:hypothetical protein
MKKTISEIREADELVGKLYRDNPDAKKGKFGYAWTKFIKKNLNPIVEDLNDRLADNRVEFALTDKTTKELLYGEDKNYKYDKEGMKQLLEANRALIKEYDRMEVEIIPFFVKEEDLPAMLDEEKEMLKGLVIE